MSAIGDGLSQSGPATFISSAYTILTADAQNGGGVGSLGSAVTDGAVQWGGQLTDPNFAGNLVGSIAGNFVFGAATGELAGALGQVPGAFSEGMSSAVPTAAVEASATVAAVDGAAAASDAAAAKTGPLELPHPKVGGIPARLTVTSQTTVLISGQHQHRTTLIRHLSFSKKHRLKGCQPK